MSKIKQLFMDIIALIVLLAPAILLGWMGWSLLGWWAGILGVVLGLLIFAYSLNKVAAQEAGAGAEAEISDTSKLN